MNKVLSIIIVLILLGLGIIGVMYFAKQNKDEVNYSANESTPSSTEAADTDTMDTSDTSLDADLGEVELEDPSGDLKDVDADINTL